MFEIFGFHSHVSGNSFYIPECVGRAHHFTAVGTAHTINLCPHLCVYLAGKSFEVTWRPILRARYKLSKRLSVFFKSFFKLPDIDSLKQTKID